jgi:hypothetical protein
VPADLWEFTVAVIHRWKVLLTGSVLVAVILVGEAYFQKPLPWVWWQIVVFVTLYVAFFLAWRDKGVASRSTQLGRIGKRLSEEIGRFVSSKTPIPPENLQQQVAEMNRLFRKKYLRRVDDFLNKLEACGLHDAHLTTYWNVMNDPAALNPNIMRMIAQTIGSAVRENDL